MNPGTERRKNLRVLFNASVCISQIGDQGRRVCSNDTRDISLKGLYVLTRSPFPVRTACRVELKLSGESSDLTLKINGEVVRIDGEGMGIRFTGMDIDALIHLKNILYYNSGEPERIDGELAGLY